MNKGIKVRIFNYEKIKERLSNYEIIHFGTETCEKLILFYENYLKDLFKTNKTIIISIPPLSQQYFNYFEKIIIYLKKFSVNKIRFSVNDFGTLSKVREFFPSIDIYVGRHLSKSFFSLTQRKLVVNSIESIKILKKNYNVFKYEISSFEEFPLNNIDLLFNNGVEVKFLVHTPYVLLSTARNCIIGFRDIMPQDSLNGIECDVNCIDYYYKMRVINLNQDLYLIENSLYKKVGDSKFINSPNIKVFNIESFIAEFL